MWLSGIWNWTLLSRTFRPFVCTEPRQALRDHLVTRNMATGFAAGVELGGTTCVSAISKLDSPTEIVSRFETPTTTPEATLEAVVKFLKKEQASFDIVTFAALGIASFGPVDLRKDSRTYGSITTTPKARWRGADVLGAFRREFGESIPIGFDTDVNAPAMAEVPFVAKAENCELPTVAYITVGTGVGVGVVVNGSPVHGLLHPEGGHMIVPALDGDDYTGSCAFEHHCCVEGMVNSLAIAERAGVGDDHEVWNTVGYYLGALCLNVTYLVSPQVIVLGWRGDEAESLYGLTRKWFKQLLKGYLDAERFRSDAGLAGYIRESMFGSEAGIIGALELARLACHNKSTPWSEYAQQERRYLTCQQFNKVNIIQEFIHPISYILSVNEACMRDQGTTKPLSACLGQVISCARQADLPSKLPKFFLTTPSWHGTFLRWWRYICIQIYSISLTDILTEWLTVKNNNYYDKVEIFRK